MGCCSSNFKECSIDGQGPEVMHTAVQLGMNRNDVNSIFRKFKYFDATHDNEVSLAEFIVLSGSECELFLQLVFRLFDRDGSGSVNFFEFLLAYYH